MERSDWSRCCRWGIGEGRPAIVTCMFCPLRLAACIKLHACAITAVPQDRSFVCLHYHLDAHGRLHPCSAGSDGMGGSVGNALGGVPAAAVHQQYSIEQSNVQLGVMVRKGVGGTCPLRCNAAQPAGDSCAHACLPGIQAATIHVTCCISAPAFCLPNRRAAARRLAVGGIVSALLDAVPSLVGPGIAAAQPQHTAAVPQSSQPTPAANGQHAQRLDGGGAPCTPAPAMRAVAAANSRPGSATASPVAAAASAAPHITPAAATQVQLSAPSSCGTAAAAGQAVSRNLAAAFVDALVGAAVGVSSVVAAADAAAVAAQPAVGVLQGPAATQPPTVQPPAAQPSAATTAGASPATARVAAPGPMQVSTADLEAALLRTAAELQAAEAAAAEVAGTMDEQLECGAEDDADEMAAPDGAAEATSQGADDASSAAKAAAAAGVAGEEGAEELLKELQEQQQALPQQQRPVAALDFNCAAADGEGATTVLSPAPLPPVHPRLTFYTLSSRWVGGSCMLPCFA